MACACTYRDGAREDGGEDVCGAGFVGSTAFLFWYNKKMNTILVCGTKKNSLSTYVRVHFEALGDKVIQFGRSLPKEVDDQIQIDLTNPDSYKNLADIDAVNVVIFSQDTGTAFGNIEDLSCEDLGSFVSSKVVGSMLFTQFLLKQKAFKEPIKLIWTCGSYGSKPKDYMLYHTVNVAIRSFVDDLNKYYSDKIEGFYVVTPFMEKTGVGEKYNMYTGKEEKGADPQDTVSVIEKIVKGDFKPGVVVVEASNVK